MLSFMYFVCIVACMQLHPLHKKKQEKGPGYHANNQQTTPTNAHPALTKEESKPNTPKKKNLPPISTPLLPPLNKLHRPPSPLQPLHRPAHPPLQPLQLLQPPLPRPPDLLQPLHLAEIQFQIPRSARIQFALRPHARGVLLAPPLELGFEFLRRRGGRVAAQTG